MKTIYRSVTKGKQIGSRLPVGLSYDEFKEMLFRIVARHKDYFSKTNQGSGKKQDVPFYLKAPLDFVDISDPGFHLYKDIQNEKDEYPDLNNLTYTHLDSFFASLQLPQDHAELMKLLEKLRKRYHKAKPERLRELPKKAQYEHMHKVNEIVRQRRKSLYGQSLKQKERDRATSAKQRESEMSRERGLKNKEAYKIGPIKRKDEE